MQRTKLCLILDCSHLNSFIEVPRIKYEGHETGLNFFKKGCHMFSFDLKDGYHHILIHPEFRTYLGFSLSLNGIQTYLRYVVGCFGLADLPFLFTKIYRPLVAHWRSLSIPAIMFLDDGGFFERDETSAIAHSDHVRKDIIRSGSIYSIKKSDFTPSQKMTWLGFVWDASLGSLTAAPHRIEKILKTCSNLLNLESCPIKSLASFVGQVVSLIPVVGSCARIMTKSSQFCIASTSSWTDTVILSELIKRELIFWKDNVNDLNYRIVSETGPPLSFNLIEGDASSTGCGSILNRKSVAARIFSENERQTHSTYRELANVHFSLHSFLSEIKGSNVKFLVDNSSAVRIIEYGSMKPELHYFAREIFDFCFRNAIKLKVEWVSRKDNVLADEISREADLVDIEDWGITNQFFEFLNSAYGPFSLDAFANYYNAKVSKFYSLYHCPKSAGVDAFMQDWNGENVLLVPPVNAIGMALSHLRACKSKGVLIAPKWPSAYFWPLIQSQFLQHIKEIRTFKGRIVLCHRLNKDSLLGAPHFQGDVLAIVLDCS